MVVWHLFWYRTMGADTELLHIFQPSWILLQLERNLVGYSQLTRLILHSVSVILLELETFRLSTVQWPNYNTVFLEMSITVKHCNVLNPATLLPVPGDGEEHNCVAAVTEVCSPRPDLQETLIPSADLELFMDDQTQGRIKLGFSVVTLYDKQIAQPLPSGLSSPGSWTALIHACKLAKGKTIVHHQLVSALLTAIVLPNQVAVCKCTSHTTSLTWFYMGTAKADAAAKAAGNLKRCTCCTWLWLSHPNRNYKNKNFNRGCKVTDAVWYGPNAFAMPSPCEIDTWLWPRPDKRYNSQMWNSNKNQQWQWHSIHQLGIKANRRALWHWHHCAYQPARCGAVERENTTLKK